MDFADLMYVTESEAGAQVGAGQTLPTGLQVGSGVRPVGTTKLFVPGTPEQTGNSLDVAIEGDGFFKVTLPGGEERYTRDGAFRLDGEGNLVTGDGLLLADAVTIPAGTVPSSIFISGDGIISGRQAGDAESAEIGHLLLYGSPVRVPISIRGRPLPAMRFRPIPGSRGWDVCVRGGWKNPTSKS